jgi:D-alanyl-D-alanine-carboxypeptidase/D-alanyl-D-alanine-endopeptidase
MKTRSCLSSLPPLSALLLATAVQAAPAIDDAQLQSLLEQRLRGDRSGACMAAAVVEPGHVARAVACADSAAARDVDSDTALEIGSVSKTLLGLLLAQEIEAGRLSLEDSLSKHLPDSVQVPAFGDVEITLGHLLSHRSGLPSLAPSWQGHDPSNPYAGIDRKALYAGLSEISLQRAPGERFEYSNLGAMLLSDVVSRSAGKPFAELVRERIFEPLGMHSFVGEAAAGSVRAQGHAPGGQPVPAWDFDPALAGVGGVRASLNDMVSYLQAQMAPQQTGLAASLERAQQPLALGEGPSMAMAWMIAPLNDARILVHEGGTGGFSSFVGFRADRGRGVVVLSDTALTSMGGLSSVALHLLDARVPMGEPRATLQAPAELIDRLVGDYRLQGGLAMQLRREGDALVIQASGQPAFEMGFDSAGDFYPLAFDALLRPKVEGDRAGFVWMQGGGVVAATRIDTAAEPAAADAGAPLDDYVGIYPLMPNFALKVFEQGEVLMAQATGQGAFELAAGAADAFHADAYGIEIRFKRGDDGRVDRLELHQGGQVLAGKRTK